MLILNDGNANCEKNGIAIFMDPIETTDDIFINSTCVFMAGIRTSASITATYDVIVYGNVSADGNVTIGGSLQCDKLECADVHASRNLVVTTHLKCESLIVDGNATIGDVYCGSAEIAKTLIVKHTIDSTGTIRVHKSVICFDAIVVDGCLQAPYIIVQNECDAVEIESEHMVILSKTQGQLPIASVSDETKQEISIGQSSIDDIFDFESVLAMRLEDIAGFIDTLQTKLRELPFDELRKYIDAYADFLPGFSILKKYISSVEEALCSFFEGCGSWYEAFCAVAQLYYNIPEWLQNGAYAESVQNKLTELLQKFNDINYRTKSRTQWAKTFNYISRLLNTPEIKPDLVLLATAALPNLYSNVGLKTLAVQHFLPED